MQTAAPAAGALVGAPAFQRAKHGLAAGRPTSERPMTRPESPHKAVALVAVETAFVPPATPVLTRPERLRKAVAALAAVVASAAGVLFRRAPVAAAEALQSPPSAEPVRAQYEECHQTTYPCAALQLASITKNVCSGYVNKTHYSETHTVRDAQQYTARNATPIHMPAQKPRTVHRAKEMSSPSTAYLPGTYLPYLSTFLPTCLPSYLPTYQVVPTYPPTYLPTYHPTSCLPTYLLTQNFCVCLSVCLSVWSVTLCRVSSCVHMCARIASMYVCAHFIHVCAHAYCIHVVMIIIVIIIVKTHHPHYSATVAILKMTHCATNIFVQAVVQSSTGPPTKALQMC